MEERSNTALLSAKLKILKRVADEKCRCEAHYSVVQMGGKPQRTGMNTNCPSEICCVPLCHITYFGPDFSNIAYSVICS